jgi:hypothetical protein
VRYEPPPTFVGRPVARPEYGAIRLGESWLELVTALLTSQDAGGQQQPGAGMADGGVPYAFHSRRGYL